MDVVNIDYVRGDTRPIEVVLTRDSGWSLMDSVIEMSIKFDDDQILHTLNGTIKDPYKKSVTFDPSTPVYSTVRSGDYDIQVDDGNYNTTHMQGRITIIPDVS